MEEEVAAVEDDEVDHRGPVKIGGVLWVVSHSVHDLHSDLSSLRDD